MALAASLLPGFSYRIKPGQRGAGDVVVIIDNKPYPDGHAEQRKIPVRLSDGTVVNILPRQLDEQPVLTPPFTSTSAAVEADIVTEALTDLLAEAKAEGELPMPGEEYQPVPPVAEAIAPLSIVDGVVDSEGRLIRGRVLNPIEDPMDPRLDHLRPSRSKVKRYINREMANGMTDVQFLLLFQSDDYRIANEGRPQNIALKGDTQSGKTFLVEVLAVAWADALGLPQADADLHDLRLVRRDRLRPVRPDHELHRPGDRPRDARVAPRHR